MLEEMYKSFVTTASCLEGFKPGTKKEYNDIQQLADGYCDAEESGDSVKMNQYISALMVRYWYMTTEMYTMSKTARLDIEDMVSWMYEAFSKAFQYKSWRDESKGVSKDPRGAEKVIERCFFSVRNGWYQAFNRDKNKINYMTYSLDSIVEDLGGDFAHENDKYETEDKSLIQKLINSGKLLEALIIDGIVNQDSFKDDGVSSEFSKHKLLQHLNTANTDNFINYFTDSFVVDRESLISTLKELETMPDYKFRATINKTMDSLKDNKELLNILC